MKKFLLTLSLILSLFACQSSGNDTLIDEPFLLPVTHEVLLFQYTPDTGNNTSRLQYAIKFTNPNPVPVSGFHQITLNSDGIIVTVFGSSSSPCYTIGANGDCTIEYDEQDSFEIGVAQSIELVAVDYVMEKQ